MKNHSKDEKSIVSLLTQIYLELADIEQEFSLLAGNGDLRPRIDYFHDAIRAFSDEGIPNKRLNVELLCYDLRCLHYIQHMPLSPFRDEALVGSPSQSVISMDGGLVPLKGKADRKIRARISELYQHYAVLFAALLKPAADHDYHDSIEIINEDVSVIQSIIQNIEDKANINPNILAQLAHKLDDDKLMDLIHHFIQQKKYQHNYEVKQLVAKLKEAIKQKDKNIKTIENAHFKFATTQLAVFEESRDMLKKLAAQGMNLVGKFVESSIASTKRQVGR